MIGRRWRLGLAVATAGMGVVVAACGADGFESSDTAFGGDGEGSTSTSGAGGGAPLPPEEELESSFGAPVATGNLVWVANPASSRVAYVNAATLRVDVVDAGNAPTYLAAVPGDGDDVAIVLNVLSFDATLLRADTQGNVAVSSYPVPSGGNGWAISGDGRWATAWTDARGVTSPDPIDGYQDITVIDLVAGTSTPLTVGYRPVALAYDAASSRLFGVTQDGISVVHLDGEAPVVAQNVKLTDDPLEDVTTRDVSITPDGSHALVRREGVDTVSVLSLDDGERTEVQLSGPVTDLDLSPSGDVAVAVVRDTGEVALLPIPEIATDPEAFTVFSVASTTIGSVVLSPASPLAFLFTNAVPSEVVTVFDTGETEPSPRSILLHAPVAAVFPTGDASHAIVLHDALAVAGTSYPSAMSVLPVAADLPSKLYGLSAPLIALAIAPTGKHALLATGSDAASSFELVVAHMPSLKIDSHALASKPIAAGIVAGANRGFVSQAHPDGRITFVDFDDGQVRTLTGFELASQVVNGGGKP